MIGRWQFIFTFAENVTHNLCCQIRADDNSSTCTFTTEKSVIFTGACMNEIIPSINGLFFYKAKEGRHVRIVILIPLSLGLIRPYSLKFTCKRKCHVI